MVSDYIRWFGELRSQDTPLVGGKNSSLGELYSALSAEGVRVPNGFAVTAQAYRDALTEAGAWQELHELLDRVDKTRIADLALRAARAREIVYAATATPRLRSEIATAYGELEKQYGSGVAVAVRSSATAEDLPNASFAGQHESYLHVCGEEDLFEACRRCFASLFTDRAIAYRLDNGFDHFKVALSVGVMKMVRSDLASSGVIFTLDTESGFRDVVFVTGSYGLGENIVQGAVDPDEFYVHKPTFRKGHRAILRRALGSKQLRMVYARGHGAHTTRNTATSAAERARFCISDADVLALADSALRIEDHYSRLAGRPMPMDIEWARDGEDGGLYIVQARPETVASRRPAQALETYTLQGSGHALVSGRAVGEKIAAGAVHIVRDKRDLGFKGLIRDFMQQIGRGYAVIVVISDKYLRSPNCMLELVEIAEGKQFHDRIFPIVLLDADIYDPLKRIEYVKYWEVKRAELARAMKELDPANLQGIRDDMDLYDRIRDKIAGLTSILKDMNTLTPTMHRDSDFTDIYNGIEKRMKAGPATSAHEKEQTTKNNENTAPSDDNITATNGSIGIGKIQVGGNMDGNIVIGNHNQVNNKK